MNRHHALLVSVVAVAGLLIRIALVSAPLSSHMDPQGHSHLMSLAQGLRAGCGFARIHNGTCEKPEVLIAPGYPVFLAMFFSNLRWALIVQSILGALVCLLLGLFLVQHAGLFVGLLATALLALDLPSATFDAMWTTESLFRDVFFLGILLALLSLTRRRFDWAAKLLGLAAALLLAAAAFVRPIGLALAPLAALPFIFRPEATIGRRVVWSALAISLTSVFLVAWTARNYYRRGVWAFSTISGFNMYYYDAAYIRSLNTGEGLFASQNALAKELGFKDAWETPDSDYRLMWKRGLRIVMASPVTAAKMVSRSLVWLAIDPVASPLAAMVGIREVGAEHNGWQFSGAVERGARFARHPLMDVLLIFQFLCTAFVWTGIARCLLRLRRDRTKRTLLIAALMLVTLFLFSLSALGAGPGATVRFRVPAMPFLVALAAMGWGSHQALCRDLGDTSFAADEHLRVSAKN